ncbi:MULTISPECIES: FKBP-type peptidyl-prolyl cis-trans isomerase [unclassified Amycolatopsis]|uniref:FKBP-type peptidyl-prolyl cis-trans isomerase n=1 Tax=unclassified Amycolatopsis TaxID=2618356 RepID=UPI001FF4856C|nr:MULTISPECIES: FKBP-type peptidyl-prolyl cis-trans isomerase [unclassified Amycolatopsis]UOZ02580.1 FKBP-type peptidyl-prolyl cis-trans isomerase [Amycolatopsis sp. WQ 127309]WSJ78072.1 FKBP-type peptidyl-prolyl cis-trans isomerase [Amycolatopsis sp. NBC_01307]WSK78367.1 FKBP-type peptidyl-prolyl cis-trans isomerase [Amycolatopsis sp. NBC_01286]
MQKIGKIVVVAAAALSLAACGQDTKTQTAAPAGPPVPSSSAAQAPQSKGRECTADDVKSTGKFGEAPTITIPDDCDPPKKLITKDLSDGTGNGAKAGQDLKMNYTLVTWSNKQKLDSSFDRGEPFDLQLGAGQVIPGWDQGLVGIKQGARRLLIIPPDLGYGQGGQGIQPNETLVFVTDAVSVPAS